LEDLRLVRWETEGGAHDEAGNGSHKQANAHVAGAARLDAVLTQE
jgi:hypothetical protein